LNAILLILPIILLRYGFMAFFGKNSMEKANFFPPTLGKEQTAYYIYQFTTLFLLIFPLFKQIHFETAVDLIGIIIYIIGAVLYMLSIIHFSKPETQGITTKGLYRFSRNPMYVAFFLYFLGCAILIHSILYFSVLGVFQVSVHFLILSEERWCLKEFGEQYADYMKKVRRYI